MPQCLFYDISLDLIDNYQDEAHEKCLKASDYEGCMNYQKR